MEVFLDIYVVPIIEFMDGRVLFMLGVDFMAVFEESTHTVRVNVFAVDSSLILFF
jgi:hypothetical protein